MPYVFSTKSCPTEYAVYRQTSNKDLSVVERKIKINGGANVATKFPNLHTPRGVATHVTDEELELLEAHPCFRIHKENGFITVEKKQVEADKVASDMRQKDTSAPRTPQDPEFQGVGVTISDGISTKGTIYSGAKGKK